MRYFDFHTHVVFKQLFAEVPNLDSKISSQDVSGLPRLCSDLPNIIQTQIHQSQLASFEDEVMVGVVLYGLESYLSKQVIPLRKNLKLASQFKMWLKLFEDIADTTAATTYKIFDEFTKKRTLEKYLAAPLSFNVVKKSSFNNSLPKNKVNIFFVIEGCHSLVNSSMEAPIDNPAKTFPPAEILANLDLLLQEVKILTINPTHMQQSNLCNHAFGMQLTSDEPFYPHGNGLTDDGRKVIQGFFDRGINADLKHMSYKSRRDLRNEIDAGKFNNVQHLLCTHSGFTGVGFNDWPGYIYTKRSVKDVYYVELVKTIQVVNEPVKPAAPGFNMTTINLFNEEIVWLVEHGGMIGLSLDRRILGYVDPNDDRPTGRTADSSLFVDKEYISKAEWSALNLDRSRLGYSIQEDDCVTEDNVKKSIENGIPGRDEYFYDYILLHLKHFLQVCFDAGIPIEQSQKHITIGSDFDGMINPFINIQTVEDMPVLKKYIAANFMFYIKSLKDSAEWADQLDVNQFTENLFYENGFNYVSNYFKTH
ncbi:hypothetical protein BH11BAC4_BH11BAC4_26730 [soil metagenome]